jgi:drug/metabolite transporter (DMT)-like permease
MTYQTSIAEPSRIKAEARGAQRSTYIRLVIVALLWGILWPLTKSVLPDIAPVTFVALRFAASAVLMLLASLPMKQPLVPVRGERAWLGFVGFWQFAANVGLAGIALQYLGAGRASILVYTMQLWALPLGWLILGERITARALLGALVGFSGLILLLNPRVLNWHDHRIILGYGIALVSAVSWGLGACLYRIRRWQTPFWTQASWQVLWSAIAIAVASVLLRVEHRVTWTSAVIWVLAFSIVGPTALAYWWWSKSLTVVSAARAGQLAALVPITAVLLSAIYTHEHISLSVGISAALIITGTVVTVGSRERPGEF